MDPNVQVVCWHPVSGEQLQFLHPQHFFRWLTNIRELTGSRRRDRDVTAWVVLEHERVIRPFQPYSEGDGAWFMVHRPRPGMGPELRIDAVEEHLDTFRQRQLATTVEEAVTMAFGDVTVELLTRTAWESVEGAGGWAPYGYVPLGHLAPNVLALCPEIVDEQGAALDDDEFTTYVDAIVLRLLARDNALHSEDVPADQVDFVVDRLMMQQNPHLFELMQRVALDQMTG